MADTKIKPTAASVDAHPRVPSQSRAAGGLQGHHGHARGFTEQQPKMWGPTMVGYGSYSYSEDLHRHAVENLEQADALLFGRVTYEMMEVREPAGVGLGGGGDAI